MKALEIKQYACCPFNRTHIVDSGKLLRHIAKCKDPAKDNYAQCQYNPLHWVLFAGIEDHKLGNGGGYVRVYRSRKQQGVLSAGP